MSELHLLATEITFLRDVGPSIYKTWGYRSITDPNPNFEDITHDSSVGHMLQSYSDILFRNLEQICGSEQLTFIPKSDSYNKLLTMRNLVEYEENHKAQKIVARYLQLFKDKNSAFKRLVTFNTDHCSKGMLYLVFAGRALCYIGDGEYKNAFDLMISLRQDQESNRDSRISELKRKARELYDFRLSTKAAMNIDKRENKNLAVENVLAKWLDIEDDVYDAILLGCNHHVTPGAMSRFTSDVYRKLQSKIEKMTLQETKSQIKKELTKLIDEYTQGGQTVTDSDSEPDSPKN